VTSKRFIGEELRKKPEGNEEKECLLGPEEGKGQCPNGLSMKGELV